MARPAKAMKKKPDRAVRKILAERGLASEVARACKVSRQAIDYWDRVPPRHAQKVSKIIEMPLHWIRPDIFPKP